MGPEILSQGLQLMLIGMGTVFSFLIFLVFITMLMSKVILGMEPARSAYGHMAEQFGVDEAHAEAIAVAIEQHVTRGENDNG